VTQPPRDLTAAVFRALYTGYEVRTHGALHVVTPKGTPVHISPSLPVRTDTMTLPTHPRPKTPTWRICSSPR
jgi:hypothetical protein